MTIKLDYMQFSAESQGTLAAFKSAFSEIIDALEEVQHIPGCNRSASLAIMHAEEAFMWAGKTIRDIQIAGEAQVKAGE